MSSGAARRVFDVCGELPTGTTVLEASAGTGKTFTIAALATRYVAEGVADLSQLMLVTFGRAATSELRDRVRERLVTAEQALRRPDARTSPDALVRHLAAVDDAELARRRRRLTRALSEFDAATIATTHGFCQQMLTSLGITGDVDADAVLVPDVADLVDEVVDDLYLQRYSSTPTPLLTEADARRVARAGVSDPQATLEPVGAPADSLSGHRYAFAQQVVAEVRRRKRVRRLLDYDDLLVLLEEALSHPEHGEAAADRVRARYRVVMVDEFQDTDPVQWKILRTAFHGHRTLVLIGDPKQAIYAFRGGDVVTYLSAADVADTTSTLGRSWRSDEPLLRGLDHVFRGAALGDSRIVVHPVDAEHRGRRLEGGEPLRVRQVMREPFGLKGTRTAPVDDVRQLVADDVAADVVRQLGVTRLRDSGGWRELRPGDVAVLTRRNADATRVREALVARGVPAVESGLSSVFATPAARDWLTLLLALEQPGHGGRTATLALTPFVGLDAQALALATDAERDDLADRVRAWSSVLTERGVAALFEAVGAEGLAERLLRTTTGERMLTDLRHIGQTLHLVSVQARLGPAALTDWLRRRMDEAGDDYAEERSRRLETDHAAVQVVTIHASKGLEFPVVYVPFCWDRYESQTPAVLTLHDKAEQRLVHVGGPESPDYDTFRDQHLVEERGEDLRLLYVALTRARSQVVVWWAPSRNSACGPLSRVLLGDYAPGQEPPAKVSVARDDVIADRLAALGNGSGGTITVETVTAAPSGELWSAPPPAQPPLLVGTLDRRLDVAWRRTSYTALAAPYARMEGHRESDASAGGVGSEPETTGVEDEWADGVAAAPRGMNGHRPEVPADDPLRQVASPMAALPGGAAFGTLVHGVLEQVDTGAADLGAEVLRRCREAVTARVPGVDASELAAALDPVLATPLGPLADGRALRDFSVGDRLAELEFELPLAGGDTPAASSSTVSDIAALLAAHLPADDIFRQYAERLTVGGRGEARLRGYLTGSLDAVLRVRREGREPRYLVVDYKTNRLAPESEALTAWHYRPAAMAEAMMHSHYPLQLLLYLVALHRFLRWRQSGYDPGRHLGGGLYLFVRGMCGPDTPLVDGTPCGVMPWRPPAQLVVELSGLLDGRAS